LEKWNENKSTAELRGMYNVRSKCISTCTVRKGLKVHRLNSCVVISEANQKRKATTYKRAKTLDCGVMEKGNVD